MVPGAVETSSNHEGYAGAGQSRRVLGRAFSARHNSLNFMRLVLALTVIVSHARGLGGFGKDWIGDRTTLATIAVYAFFGISGFLIAGSARRNSLGRFLWQRALRIVPGFWVCLVVTAFFFALRGWLSESHLPGHPGGVSSYLDLRDGPIQYVFNNLYFKMRQSTIGGIGWNASLWTLFYELLCYVLLGLLAVLGLLRRRHIVLILT